MHNEIEPDINDNNNEPKKATSYNLFKDTALLGGFISVIAYLVTYSFEKGYNSYFHISDNFINEITLTNVIDTITIIIVPVVILFLGIEIFQTIIPDSRDSNLARVIRHEYASYNLILFFILIISGDNVAMLKMLLYFFLGTNLLITIRLFYKYRKERGIKAKLAKYAENPIRRISMFAVFAMKGISIFKKILFLVMIFNMLPYSMEMFGKNQAALKKDFLIINQSTPLLVVKEYKDKLLVAPVNIEKGIVTPKYKVIDIQSNLKESIELESITFKDGITVEEPKSYNN